MFKKVFLLGTGIAIGCYYKSYICRRKLKNDLDPFDRLIIANIVESYTQLNRTQY
jgi:PIN domain nuclease of toxin-antitoxin system